MANTFAASAAQPLARRSAGLPFAAVVLAGVAATTLFAGARFGLMLVLGLGFGVIKDSARLAFVATTFD